MFPVQIHGILGGAAALAMGAIVGSVVTNGE